MNRDNKIKRGDKEYNYFEIGYHWGRKEFGVDLQYETPEVFKPGTRWERPIMSTYGGYECFAKDILGVIDCIEQKYGVKVRVEGASMDEINRAAQLVHEEAVAPKPQEIGLFEVMESNSGQVLAEMKSELGRFCTSAGVGKHVTVSSPGVSFGAEGHDYARKTCKDVLEDLITNLDLEISNEDWSTDLEQGTVKRKLNEILVRDKESAEYMAEEKWGVAPREPYNRGSKSKAEQLAESLMEPFKTGQNEYLNSIGDETARKLESGRLKDAIRLFLQSYAASMKRRVKQLA